MSKDDATTTEILGFLQDNMVTKEEALGFATKKDLESFATKKDLESFATKKDLATFKLDFLDSMDDKLADLKADLIILMRKGDTKVTELIKVLEDKDILNEEEAERLLAFAPFPQA